MPNQPIPWIQYSEEMVGAQHPTLEDTLNRAAKQVLSASGFTVTAPFYGLPIGSKTYNAAAFTGATDEAQITAAIAQAAADAVSFVFVPAAMAGFDASLVTYDAAVQVVQEGGASVAYRIGDLGTKSAGFTVDWTQGPLQRVTLGASPLAIAFTDPPVAGTVVQLHVKQDASGSRTVTWPASVKWPSAIAPTLTTAASATDIFTFLWTGAAYAGITAGLNYGGL